MAFQGRRLHNAKVTRVSGPSERVESALLPVGLRTRLTWSNQECANTQRSCVPTGRRPVLRLCTTLDEGRFHPSSLIGAVFR